VPEYGGAGAITTKPGRFAFAVPRPYVTQLPTLGRATANDPVCMPSVPLSWADVSVVIELMTQMSSITPASPGKISLTGVPHLPAGWNAQFGRFRCRVNDPFCMNHRSAVTLLPWSAKSFGLWSNVSTCDTPPVE
jgi:hypothetical protein